MRNRGPSKQRLWLGAGRHLCCSGRRYTDADAHCYCDSDCHSNGQRHGYSDSDRHANCHAATDTNTQVGTIGKAAPHASAQAIDFTEPKVFFVIGDR